MTKQKVLLLIPLAIVAGFLMYGWATILFTDIIATWRHYFACILFTALVFFYFKSLTKAVLATGIYLVIGTCNLLTLTPLVTSDSFGLRIFSVQIETPPFQLLSFGLLVLFSILNFDTLTNIYLDFKDAQQAKKEK
jgi:hypothetical protein